MYPHAWTHLQILHLSLGYCCKRAYTNIVYPIVFTTSFWSILKKIYSVFVVSTGGKNTQIFFLFCNTVGNSILNHIKLHMRKNYI